MSKPPVWIAPLFGGIALTAMSAGTTYYVEKTAPKAKVLARDFILGAILVLCIMQVLPESVSNGIAMLMTASTVFVPAVIPPVEAIVPPTVFVPDFTGSDEVEVRVGVPKF